MNQQLSQVFLFSRRNPDPRKPFFCEQLHQQPRVPLVVLLLTCVAGANLCRVPNPQLMPYTPYRFDEPLAVPGGFHPHPRTGWELAVELLHRSRCMHQLLIPCLTGRAIQPRNLLPTGMKITSNKNHKAPSVPRVSVLNQRLLGPRLGAFSLIQSTLCVLCKA